MPVQGSTIDEKVDATLDRLLVEFGKEILAIVPGKVSTEVDARFSFDIEASLKKALHIIDVGRGFPVIARLLTRTALQIDRNSQGAYPHQGCLDLGRYSNSAHPAVSARHQL